MLANSGPESLDPWLCIPVFCKTLIGPIYLEEVPASADLLLCGNGDTWLFLTRVVLPIGRKSSGSAIMTRVA